MAGLLLTNSFPFISMLLLVLYALTLKETFANEFPSATFTTSPNSALRGFITETYAKSSLLECAQHCLRLLHECKSFNFKEKWDGSKLCEINNGSKVSALPEDFVEDDESVYAEIFNIQEKNDDIEVRNNSYKDHQADGFYSSSILERENQYISQLHLWLNNETDWSLCYRASQDGWRGANFHWRCDDKGPTVTIVAVDKYIFGGYTEISWGGLSGYKSSTSSFLFSLRNKDNLDPFRSPVYRNRLLAIFQYPDFGPVFGKDVVIKDTSNIRGAHSTLGHVYQPPPGYTYLTSQCSTLLAGNPIFYPTEIEVFYLA